MPGLLTDLPQGERDLTSNLPGPTYVKGADGLPTVQEKLVDPIIPAVPDNLVCLDGCVHYRDWVIDSMDIGEGRELQRFCRAMGTASELMDITDGAVYGCTCFRPKWWSWAGWKRWWKCRKYMAACRQKMIDRDMELLEEQGVVVIDGQAIEVYDD